MGLSVDSVMVLLPGPPASVQPRSWGHGSPPSGSDDRTWRRLTPAAVERTCTTGRHWPAGPLGCQSSLRNIPGTITLAAAEAFCECLSYTRLAWRLCLWSAHSRRAHIRWVAPWLDAFWVSQAPDSKDRKSVV